MRSTVIDTLPPKAKRALGKLGADIALDRHVTRKEYVKLWSRCFELDNFSNAEIAAAMSALAGVTIRGADLAACRPSLAAKAKPTPLGDQYRALTGHALDKVALAHTLVDRMFDPAAKRRPANRPIIRFLQLAAERAALNHQPTNLELWEENQRSGYLGALRPGADSRRKYRRRV